MGFSCYFVHVTFHFFSTSFKFAHFSTHFYDTFLLPFPTTLLPSWFVCTNTDYTSFHCNCRKIFIACISWNNNLQAYIILIFANHSSLRQYWYHFWYCNIPKLKQTLTLNASLECPYAIKQSRFISTDCKFCCEIFHQLVGVSPLGVGVQLVQHHVLQFLIEHRFEENVHVEGLICINPSAAVTENQILCQRGTFHIWCRHPILPQELWWVSQPSCRKGIHGVHDQIGKHWLMYDCVWQILGLEQLSSIPAS